MKHYLFSIQLLFSTTLMLGQTTKVTNQGIMYVSPSSVLSIVNDFDNTTNGDVTADGTIYFYANFNNDNDFNTGNDLKIHNTDKSARVVFSKLEDNGVSQIISGDGVTYFQDLVLDSDIVSDAFILQNELNIKGNTEFKNGIVKVDSLTRSMITFHQGATVKKVSDNSHVDGLMEKIGNEGFTFPSGNKGKFRRARISAPPSVKDVFVEQYYFRDDKFFNDRLNKAGVIKEIDTKEYWLITKGNKNASGDVLLTLSWDERTTPSELLRDTENELHIVRWDYANQIWVDEGGVVDLDTKEITTATTVSGYGFFTLGIVDKSKILGGDVVIYNYVSPNSGALNDFFRIDNINKYPDNSVEIFNRWGQRVYYTTNYNSGADNVFRGFSDGKITINKGELLPSGTYFYIVKYNYTHAGGSELIKKTGYLHLETN